MPAARPHLTDDFDDHHIHHRFAREAVSRKSGGLRLLRPRGFLAARLRVSPSHYPRSVSSHDESAWLPIEYGEFYDVPRLFWIVRRGTALLFNCPFSDELDDYPDHYEVYVLPLDALPKLEANGEAWVLPQGASAIARVGVDEVRFDESRRRAVRRDLIAGFAGPS